jgi:hypothetical protein
LPNLELLKLDICYKDDGFSQNQGRSGNGNSGLDFEKNRHPYSKYPVLKKQV